MPIVVPAVSCHPKDLLTSLPVDGQCRRWLVACTMPRQEKSLARDLFQRGIPFYLPLLPKRLRYKGRSTKSYLPLFSGFVFLFANEQERLMALATGRITTILDVADQAELQNDLQRVEQTLNPIAQNGEACGQNGASAFANHGAGSQNHVDGVSTVNTDEGHVVLSVGFLRQNVIVENGAAKQTFSARRTIDDSRGMVK